jgi:hypothetical protein
MPNLNYPFKSSDRAYCGFGKRVKPASDHIPDATKMVDKPVDVKQEEVKPDSDKNKYTMLPADPEGFIIFKPDFDTPCGEILAWVDDFSDNAQKILAELNRLQERIKELEDMNAHLKKCLAIFSDPLLAKIDEEAYVCRECDYKDCKCHLSPEELLQWKKEAHDE